MYLHRNFGSSTLVRLLGEAAAVDVDVSRQDVAQRLGLWLDTLDTLKLSAAHQAIKGLGADRPSDGQADSPAALQALFLNVKNGVVQAITDGAAAGIDPEAGYGPWRQRYLDRQRQMASAIGSLRGHVRQVLSRASPPLRQLAYLDAAMDQMLGAREQKLLSTVPVLLERRFAQARQTEGGGDFRQAWQEALLAEMHARLQPVLGLVEAFSNGVEKTQ